MLGNGRCFDASASIRYGGFKSKTKTIHMKYFTLLLISIAALTARAQYIDLLQSDTSLHWFAAHDNTSLNGTTHSETSENFIGHDTMINGRQYAITYNGLQRRHFREDAQHRIYALDPNDTVETLLYAFDAQPGRYHSLPWFHRRYHTPVP